MTSAYRDQPSKDSVVLYEDFQILCGRVKKVEERREDSEEVKAARIWIPCLTIVILSVAGAIAGCSAYGSHCDVLKAFAARDQAAIARDQAHEEAMKAMWEKQPPAALAKPAER
jgi:hypothetical protein